jgi:hypothetical protein
METLFIESTEDTPKIILDAQNNLFEISRRSLPEDSTKFFAPVMEWISTYSQSPNSKTDFNFKLEYFNTASAKQILKILVLLQDLSAKSDVSVFWNYEKEDMDMRASGERYSKLVNVKMEMVEM